MEKQMFPPTFIQQNVPIQELKHQPRAVTPKCKSGAWSPRARYPRSPTVARRRGLRHDRVDTVAAKTGKPSAGSRPAAPLLTTLPQPSQQTVISSLGRLRGGRSRGPGDADPETLSHRPGQSSGTCPRQPALPCRCTGITSGTQHHPTRLQARPPLLLQMTYPRYVPDREPQVIHISPSGTRGRTRSPRAMPRGRSLRSQRFHPARLTCAFCESVAVSRWVLCFTCGFRGSASTRGRGGWGEGESLKAGSMPSAELDLRTWRS